ncbi:MAG: transposase, partial [Clostridia bacterium]|nr:transposase [Clostridia bacterium]
MKLSFKYIVDNAKDNQVEIVDDLMWHVCKVMNIFTYGIRQKEFKINLTGSINIESSKIYKYFRESNWHSKYLHSHTLQEAIISVIASEKSYNELNKMYEKDKTSLKGEPKEPKYRKKDVVEIVFTKYAIRYEGKYIKLSLSKEMQKKYQVKSLNFLISNKLRKLVDFEHVKMIKVRKIQGKIELNIIYEKEEQKVKETNTNIVGIDLGLTNIVACTNRDNAKALLISGGPVKSKNRYIMEKISYLQKVQMHMDKDAKYYKNTKQIKRLYEKRRNYIETYMHKVSRMVITYAKENNAGKIVIGDLKDIKQNMDYNKNFVQIPLQNLVEKIKYKAAIEGIEVDYISEKYTSGVSALDKEEIIKENYNKSRRKYRGLFITNKGKKINADING